MVETTGLLIEAEPEDEDLSAERLERITRLVHDHVDQGRLPGAETLIARHGKVVYHDVYGSMDLEAGKPLRPDTIYRIYSMTKPIVSVALMMLYEEGHFQLDDAVSKYIPEFASLKVLTGGTAESPQLREPTREMQIRDLLTHTSGLESGRNTNTVVAQMYQAAGLPTIAAESATLKDTIEVLGRMPLAFDPGTAWLYSVATDVVGYLVEVFSGQPLDRYLEEQIFLPLDMPDTGFHAPVEKHDRLAANYRPGGDGEPALVLIDAPATSRFAQPQTYFSGVGGLVSTMHDYTRFCKMLGNEGELDGTRLLGPRTLSLMTSNHLPGGADLAAMNTTGFSEVARYGQGFGLGFSVLLDPVQAAVTGTPGEYGWGGAAGTVFFDSPEEDLFLIFMTQLMPAQFIRRQLRALTYAAIVDSA